MVPGSNRIRQLISATAVMWGLLIYASAGPQAQAPADTNPLAGNATAITQGRNIYRGRCGVFGVMPSGTTLYAFALPRRP